MGRFIFDRSSGVPFEQQRRAHLQQQGYVDDVVGAIESSVKEHNARSKEIEAAVRTGAEEVGATIVAASMAEIETARRNAAAIVGSVELASDRITDHIDSLGRALDYRLAASMYQQAVSNLLLGDIAQLMRIPDFQKERLYYTEQGLKHFTNARKLDPTFYREALEALLKAEEREKTDCIVLYTIGMIYSYSPTLSDLTAAEGYFLRAARYAVIESNPEAARLKSILWRDHPTNIPAAQRLGPKRSAAEALMEAGFACYGQGKFPDAAAHGQRAVEVDPAYLLARFNACKFLTANGSVAEAVRELEPVIRTDRYYSVSTADDPDLAPQAPVRALLTRLRDEAADQLKSGIQEIMQNRAPFLGENGDQNYRIQRLNAASQAHKYLGLLQALDESPDVERTIFVWKETCRGLNAIKSLIDRAAPTTVALDQALSELPHSTQYSYVETLYGQLRATDRDQIDAQSFVSQVSTASAAISDAQARYEGSAKSLQQLRKAIRNLRSSSSWATWNEFASTSEHSIDTAKNAIAGARQEIAMLSNSAQIGARRSAERTIAVLQEVVASIEPRLAEVKYERATAFHKSIVNTYGYLMLVVILGSLYAAPGLVVARYAVRSYDVSHFWVPVLNWLMFFLASIVPADPSSPFPELTFSVFILTVLAVVGLIGASVAGFSSVDSAFRPER